MKPGPPRKPTVLKALAGNPGKRALPKHEPQPKGGCPSAPAGMTPEGRAEWRRTARKLYALGLLTWADRPAFTSLCELCGMQDRATRALRRDGDYVTGANGGLVRHPAVSVLRGLADPIRKLSAEFGLTPSSRTRVFEGPDDGGAKPKKPLPFDT